MNNKEVAHLWAHKAKESAKGSSFYFENDTIYSYGSHFPIARHVTRKGKNAILFTTRSYSSTTAKHKRYTLCAIPSGDPVFYVADVTREPDKDTLAEIAAQIESAGKAAALATKNAGWKLEQLKGAVETGNNFAVFFGFRKRFKMPANLGELKARAKAQAAAEVKRTAERNRKLAAECERLAAEWVKGGSYGLPYNAPFAYLRVKAGEPDTVETSKGATVPLEHVRKALAIVMPLLAAGTTYQRNGHTIHVGNYAIDSVNERGEVRAGCHVFERKEIERFAAVCGQS